MRAASEKSVARAALHCPVRWRDRGSCVRHKQFCWELKEAEVSLRIMATHARRVSIRWRSRRKLRARNRLPQFQIAASDRFHCLCGIQELEELLAGSGRFSFQRRTRAIHAAVFQFTMN